MGDAPGAILVSDHVASRHADALAAAAPGAPLAVLGPYGVRGPLEDVVAAFFSADCYPARGAEFFRAVFAAPRLRWLHSFSAGVDHPVFQTLLDRGVTLTTSSGASAVEIAHTAFLYLLALTRDLPGWLDAQRRHAWEPRRITELAGRTLAVVGMGSIGLAAARLGLAFGLRVVGLRRTPRGDEPCETWPLGRLHELLAQADHVILALPLRTATRGILDAAAFAATKRGALLVNVGRGELVDEAALVAALRDGRLGGAGLDVFATEPLPADSPLWDMPRVIVTPHSAGETVEAAARAEARFLDNLARFAAGAPLPAVTAD